MYVLEYVTHFDAAHHLPDHPHCGGIHGHRWEVKIRIETQFLIKGFVMDFKKLSSLVNKLDHPGVELNEFVEYPSCENISRYLYDQIKEKITQPFFELKVTVKESPESSITYHEEK